MPTVNLDAMHTQAERQHQVLDIPLFLARSHTQRPVLHEVIAQSFTSIYNAQLVIVVVDTPGNHRFVLDLEFFIIPSFTRRCKRLNQPPERCGDVSKGGVSTS